MPIFVKTGNIVPMGPVMHSAAEANGPLKLRIYPSKNTDYILYEDSGNGYAFEHGEHSMIT